MASVRFEGAGFGRGVFGPAMGVVGAMVIAAPALAGISINFIGLTNTNSFTTSVGQSQLFMDVDVVGSTASFVLSNTGPTASSATDIYFDDDRLLGSAAVLNGPGTAFAQTVSPASLPGANLASPPFVTSESFASGGSGPFYSPGVNPHESVTVTIQLLGQKTINDVIADLNSGALRVAVRVRGTETGGDETFINMPIPGAPTIGALALGGLGMSRRRR